MKIIETKSYDELSRIASDLILEQINEKADSVISLATGSTPIGTYKCLIEACKKGEVDFSKVRTINLDEYCGLSPSNEQSYRYFMDDNLFNHININKDNTFLPDGLAEDLDAECVRYDNLINDLGSIDIQILGIGVNGHVAFNEPSDSFPSGTHIEHLTELTIESNSRFFEDIKLVPTTAITVGMKSIMSAKKVILLASGINKKEIIEKSLYGKITPNVPASILQLHPNLIVITCFD